MKKWRLIVGVILVFILGLLMGSLGARFYHRDWWSEPFGKDSSSRRVVVLKKLTEELRLTEAQQKEFKGIVEETDQKLEAFGLERRAEIKTILDESFSRMKEKLDLDQQKKLEELKARHEARLKDKKSRHHFP